MSILKINSEQFVVALLEGAEDKPEVSIIDLNCQCGELIAVTGRDMEIDFKKKTVSFSVQCKNCLDTFELAPTTFAALLDTV